MKNYLFWSAVLLEEDTEQVKKANHIIQAPYLLHTPYRRFAYYFRMPALVSKKHAMTTRQTTGSPSKCYLRKWWRDQDLNLRTPKRPDLQSGAFNHSTTPPV